MTSNFSEQEAIRSAKAEELSIDNTPDSEALSNIRFVAAVLEYVAWMVKDVTSWYRCELLNKAVAGHSNSFHLLGLAIDFTTTIPRGDCIRILKGLHLPKLRKVIIYENSRHMHISFFAPDANFVKPTEYLLSLGNNQYRSL